MPSIPNDDAIVLKSSFALGTPRACENITITNCLVSGFDVGSVLDGTFKRTVERAPDRDGPTGRIKLGTAIVNTFSRSPALIAMSAATIDEMSEGLLLMTNDGELAFHLIHPRFGIPKTYLALVAGKPTQTDIQKLLDGVWLSDGKVKAKDVKRMKPDRKSTRLNSSHRT